MAITPLGRLVDGLATASTTLAITNTSGATIPAGTVLLIVLGFDNHASATAPTVTLANAPNGEVFQRIGTAPFGQGVSATAGSGVWLDAWGVKLTADLAAGATVTTVTFSAAPPKAVAVGVGLAGADVTLRGGLQSGGSAAGTPSAASGGTLPVAGDAVVGMAVGETSAAMTADADTTGGSWSALATHVTSGGAAAVNVRVGIQVKVVTAGGSQTYNPTTANDSVARIFALVPAPVVDNRNGTFALSGGGAATDAGTKAVSRAVGVLSGGGALAAAARKAVSRTAGALSGGGSLAGSGGPPRDDRTGTFGLAGGGELLATGRHGRTAALGVMATGGGTPAATGRKAVSRSAGTVSGGGALVATGRHGALRALLESGGGALAAAARKAVSRALGTLATGGGTPASSGTHQGRATISVSGGGTPTSSGTAATGPKNASGTFALSGGGAGTAAGRKSVARTVAVTGGGALSSSARKASAGTLLVTGGGALAVTARHGALRQLSQSGGGTPALSTRSGRRGTLTLSGGGALTAVGLTVKASDPPTARGPGRTIALARSGQTTSVKTGRTGTLTASGPGRTGGALL